MPFDDWIDLLIDLLKLSCPCLRLTRRDMRVLHLRCLGVRLELVHFVGLICVASEETTGKLLKQVMQDTDILAAVF